VSTEYKKTAEKGVTPPSQPFRVRSMTPLVTNQIKGKMRQQAELNHKKMLNFRLLLTTWRREVRIAD
jgi:hypothetical protein